MKMLLLTLAVMVSNSEAEAADLHCLANMIYSEARGEPVEGQIAVGYTVVNRLKKFSKPVCWIVRHGYTRKKIPPAEVSAFLAVAEGVLSGRLRNPIGDADSFDSRKGRHARGSIKIGRHYFRRVMK